MRAVIDTCVIIDFATGRDERLLDQAGIILASSYLRKYEGFITSNTVTDIYYILHRLTHDNTQAKEYLNKILDYVSILDVSDADCRKALSSKTSDYEDSVMIECASRNKIDYIITDNIQDFKNSKIPAVCSGEFIRIIAGKGN